MNVCVVGSTGIPLANTVPILTELLQTLAPRSPKVLVRTPRSGDRAPFESEVVRISTELGLEIVPCYPDRRGGREGTYVRDAHMAQTADVVFAFFTPERLMDGGTGHVVEKALDKGTPVHAYEIDEDGLRWVGSVG